MGKPKKSRAGSLQYWPRKRAKRIYPNVRTWKDSKKVQLLGFVGYKVGMTHVVLKDSRAHSLTKGEQIVWPVTILECPALKLFGIRGYINDYDGKRAYVDLINVKVDKELGRKINLSKKSNYEEKLKDFESNLSEMTDLRVIVYTQPKKTGIGKKKPEILEIGLGGEDVKAKYDYAKSLFDKEIKVSELFKANCIVDIHGVTKGKGFQGAFKRFGLTLRSHKSEKSRRVGNLGSQGFSKVSYKSPLGGQTGYNTRTESNKELLLVGTKPENINIKSGFIHYGTIKNEYILIKGSLPGTVKRLVRITESVRKAVPSAVEVVSVRLKQ